MSQPTDGKNLLHSYDDPKIGFQFANPDWVKFSADLCGTDRERLLGLANAVLNQNEEWARIHTRALLAGPAAQPDPNPQREQKRRQLFNALATVVKNAGLSEEISVGNAGTQPGADDGYSLVGVYNRSLPFNEPAWTNALQRNLGASSRIPFLALAAAVTSNNERAAREQTTALLGALAVTLNERGYEPGDTAYRLFDGLRDVLVGAGLGAKVAIPQLAEEKHLAEVKAVFDQVPVQAFVARIREGAYGGSQFFSMIEQDTAHRSAELTESFRAFQGAFEALVPNGGTQQDANFLAATLNFAAMAAKGLPDKPFHLEGTYVAIGRLKDMAESVIQPNRPITPIVQAATLKA